MGKFQDIWEGVLCHAYPYAFVRSAKL